MMTFDLSMLQSAPPDLSIEEQMLDDVLAHPPSRNKLHQQSRAGTIASLVAMLYARVMLNSRIQMQRGNGF